MKSRPAHAFFVAALALAGSVLVLASACNPGCAVLLGTGGAHAASCSVPSCAEMALHLGTDDINYVEQCDAFDCATAPSDAGINYQRVWHERCGDGGTSDAGTTDAGL